MTDTPTKQEIQSKSDNVPGAMPVEQKKNNRNDRKRNRRGDSKNLERDYIGYEVNSDYCDLAKKRINSR